MAADYVVGQLASFRSLELLAAGCLQDGAALLNDVGHVLSAEIHNLVGDETAVAAIYTFYFQTAEDGRAGHGADCGIHARGVASGCEDADSLDGRHSIIWGCFFDDYLIDKRFARAQG